MINLFDLMKKLSEEKLKEQGAFLETLTMTNVSKQTSQKIANKFVQATQLLTGLMKKEPFQVEERFNIEELLEENLKKWDEYTGEEVENHIKEVLKRRCSKLNTSCLAEDLTEEAFSLLILEEAGHYYHLKEELLPSQKADLIAKFYRKELQHVRRELGEQYSETEEKNITDLQSDTEVECLERVLGKVTEMQCILHLGGGRNKLIRLLLARWINLCVQACDGGIVIKEEDLPSFQTPKERVKQDYEYQALLKQHEHNEREYEKVLHILLEADHNLSRRNKIVECEIKKQLEIQTHLEQCLKSYQEVKNNLNALMDAVDLHKDQQVDESVVEIELQRLTKEVKIMEKQVKLYESMLSLSAEEVEGNKKSIELITLNKDQAIAPLLKKWADKRLITANEIEVLEEKKQKELMEKWQAAYKDFLFDEKCLEGMRHFSFHELLDIERALSELERIGDKKAISWGKLEQKDYEVFELDINESPLEHLYFSLYGGEIIILIYRIQKESDAIKIIKISRVAA